MINKLTSYSSQERKHVETINSELLKQPSLPQHISIGFFYITMIATGHIFPAFYSSKKHRKLLTLKDYLCMKERALLATSPYQTNHFSDHLK